MIGKITLPVTVVLLLVVVLLFISDQVVHDLAVVFDAKARQTAL